MDWLPCLGELSNHFCFLFCWINYHESQVYWKLLFWISVLDDRIVNHHLTEEDVVLCDQVEKLLYTAMKQLIPTYDDVK